MYVRPLMLLIILGCFGSPAMADDLNWAPPFEGEPRAEAVAGDFPNTRGPNSLPADEPLESADAVLENGCPASVLITRSASSENARLELTTCLGEANDGALEAISVLARPEGTSPPPTPDDVEADVEVDVEVLAPHIRQLDPGLLVRLQAIATHYPGEAIIIVSGYRPEPGSRSRHAHASAIDIQVTGTNRWELASFARTLASTGVGYYPNSAFTHIDVREGASVAWMDRSRPGEAANYAPWPEGPEDTDATTSTSTVASTLPSPEVEPAEDDALLTPPPTMEEIREAVQEAIDVADRELPRTELTL